jgi:hypothetical protein
MAIHLQAHLAAGTGAGSVYFIAPRACTVRNLTGLVSTDPGVDVVATVSEGGVTIGASTIADGTAIATNGATYVASTTDAYANRVVDAGDVITVAADARTNSCTVDYFLELDEFGLTA